MDDLLGAAEAEKNKGNEAFSAQDYQTAIDHYTKAIQLNPKGHIYFTNRSNTFHTLKRYEEALQDAGASVELKPDWAKGYYRKGEALLALRDFEAASKAFRSCVQFDKSETTNTSITNSFQARYQVIYKSVTQDKPVCVKFVSPTVGKGMFATRNISKGEVIFFEKPLFCQQWTRSKKITKCCAACMRFLGPALYEQLDLLLGKDPLRTLPMHDQMAPKLAHPVLEPATQLSYCSQTCLDKSLPVHSILYKDIPEAKLFLDYSFSNAMVDRYVLAAEVIIGLLNDVFIKKTPKATAWEHLSLFMSGSWVDLLSAQKEGQPDAQITKQKLTESLAMAHGLFLKLLTAVYGEPLLQPDAPWSSFLQVGFFDQILGIFELNNPMIEIQSPFNTYFENLAKKKEYFQQAQPTLAPIVSKIHAQYGETIPTSGGHGLFTLHSCINHSCNPNVKQESNDRITSAEIVLVASRAIKKNEEISISYIRDTKDFKQRQRELRINYGFICECTKCQQK